MCSVEHETKDLEAVPHVDHVRPRVYYVKPGEASG